MRPFNLGFKRHDFSKKHLIGLKIKIKNKIKKNKKIKKLIDQNVNSNVIGISKLSCMVTWKCPNAIQK